jgi:hypothetical protein
LHAALHVSRAGGAIKRYGWPFVVVVEFVVEDEDPGPAALFGCVTVV